MKRFWNWVKDTTEARTLYLDGVISDDTWWGDEVTPKMFKAELMSDTDDITVWINSPGGDVFAGSQIYTMLMEYPGEVTVKIDGIAASAASVVAMAGDKILMSPTANMMIHNPATIAIGNAAEMAAAKDMLDEIKEAIINAYELRTKQKREYISELMDAETWMSAKTAVELGFADEMMYETSMSPDDDGAKQGATMIFSRTAVTNSLVKKLSERKQKESTGTPIELLDKRLELLLH